MRIEIHCDTEDMGTPIEVANAIIKNYLNNVYDFDLADLRKKELAEIAEHIQVYLKYSGVQN